MLNQVWVFGGVCIDDKNFFCIVIPNRKIDVLEKKLEIIFFLEQLLFLIVGKHINFLMNVMVMNT